jgi:membrane associated rhomboid family serine protease
MIPLRDDVPSRTTPVVTIAFLVVNVVVFVLELGMGPGLERFLYQAAVIPALYTGDDGSLDATDLVIGTLNPSLLFRLVFSMFLHGGLAHILGNMLYLWIFGDNIEDRLGHVRFVFFYFLCGWAASFAHIWSSPDSILPSIGASGAIAGILGAYIALYPHARVVTVVPLGFVFPLVQLPAFVLLGVWFLQQFVVGAMSLTERTAQTGGTAWWAHIGGFVAGLLLVGLLQKPQRRPAVREVWWDDGSGRRPRGW